MNEITFMSMLDSKATTSVLKKSGQGGGFDDMFGSAMQEGRITEQRRETRESRETHETERTERPDRPEKPDRAEKRKPAGDDQKQADKAADDDVMTPDEVVAKLAKEVQKMEEATGEAPTQDEMLAMLQEILAEAGLGQEQQQKIMSLFENATTPEGVKEFSDALLKLMAGEEKTSDSMKEAVANFKEEVKNLRTNQSQNSGASADDKNSELWEKLSSFKHSFTSSKEDADGTDVTRQLIDKLMGQGLNNEKSSESFLNARLNTQAGNATPVVRVMEPSDLIQIAKFMESPNANGAKTLEVQLNPAHLGKVNIELTDIAGKISAKVIVEQDVVKHMFVSQADQIREQLANKGIVIDNMEFAFMDSSEKEKEQQELAKQSSKKKGSAMGGFSDDNADDAETTEKDGIYA